ncbi:MAG: recombinase family protein [Amaricoccus sp.]
MKFAAVDLPEANDLTVGIMALVAQQEREAISKRTKEALAIARSRGVKRATRTARQPCAGLVKQERRYGPPSRGTPSDMSGTSHRWSTKSAPAARPPPGDRHQLNDRGMLIPRGVRWHVSKANLLDRLGVRGRHAPVSVMCFVEALRCLRRSMVETIVRIRTRFASAGRLTMLASLGLRLSFGLCPQLLLLKLPRTGPSVGQVLDIDAGASRVVWAVVGRPGPETTCSGAVATTGLEYQGALADGVGAGPTQVTVDTLGLPGSSAATASSSPASDRFWRWPGRPSRRTTWASAPSGRSGARPPPVSGGLLDLQAGSWLTWKTVGAARFESLSTRRKRLGGEQSRNTLRFDSTGSHAFPARRATSRSPATAPSGSSVMKRHPWATARCGSR